MERGAQFAVAAPRNMQDLKDHMRSAHRTSFMGGENPGMIEGWHQTLHERTGLHFQQGCGQGSGWERHEH